jgi:hypothetical protein
MIGKTSQTIRHDIANRKPLGNRKEDIKPVSPAVEADVTKTANRNDAN